MNEEQKQMIDQCQELLLSVGLRITLVVETENEQEKIGISIPTINFNKK